jgi:hypothetical protein
VRHDDAAADAPDNRPQKYRRFAPALTSPACPAEKQFTDDDGEKYKNNEIVKFQRPA